MGGESEDGRAYGGSGGGRRGRSEGGRRGRSEGAEDGVKEEAVEGAKEERRQGMASYATYMKVSPLPLLEVERMAVVVPRFLIAA